MPIPKPEGSESQGAFISRCVEFVMAEGTPQEQAVAICYREWEQGEKGQYWIKFEKSRRTLEAWTARQFREAIRQSAKPILEARSISEMKAADVDIQPIRDAFVKVYQRVGREFASAIYKNLTRKKNELLFTSWDDWMERFALTEAGTKIVGIGDTTLKRIRRVIDQGIKDELGTNEIARNIRSSSAMSMRRAQTIARTEVIGASNAGAVLGADSTGLEYRKEWIASIDSRTRSFDNGDEYDHIEMDGVIIDKNESFATPTAFGVELLKYPGDPDGSPGNIINCRCTVGFIPYE